MKIQIVTYCMCFVIIAQIDCAFGNEQSVTSFPNVSTTVSTTTTTRNSILENIDMQEAKSASEIPKILNPILDAIPDKESVENSESSEEEDDSRSFSPIMGNNVNFDLFFSNNSFLMSFNRQTFMHAESFWETASRHLASGIHKLRESLHEGVRVAALLREDVDEGMSHIKGKSLFTDTEHGIETSSLKRPTPSVCILFSKIINILEIFLNI